MTAFRVQAKRTTASGPPADLEFGELAYSDADQQFYVGRPAPEAPATFKGDIAPVDLAPVNAAIAAIEADQDSQDAAITALIAEDLALAQAIASFETTAQLDTRDAANRARGNHTGTQPANTISGLAAVATSGTYGDLSGSPSIPFGFTYDQQAEPIGPSVGQTWRERSADGLITGNWQWDGTYWESLRTEIVQLFGWATQIAATTPFYGSPIGVPFKLLGYKLSCAGADTAQNDTQYWQFTALTNFGIAIDTREFPGLFSNGIVITKMLAAPVIRTLPTNSNELYNLRAIRFGTTGVIRRGCFLAIYREVRL